MTGEKAQTVSASGAWIILILVVAFILVKGCLTFIAVGNPGPPTWNYGVIEDVPGESRYAIYKESPASQHVMGRGGN